MSVFAALGFMIWGLFVNWEYGVGARIQVASTQAIVSFISTLSSAELLRMLFKKLLLRLKIRAIICPILGWTILNAFVIAAHKLAGTPELWGTIWPGMITGMIFCIAYSYRLFFEAKKNA